VRPAGSGGGPPVPVLDPLREAGVTPSSKENFKPLPPREQAAYTLARWTGAGILFLTFLLVIQWWTTVPDVPTLPSTGVGTPVAEEPATKLVANYQTLNTAVTTRSTTLFDTIVARTLLPVFTALLGYLFGTHAASNRASDNT
jgi:hypothetical protein